MAATRELWYDGRLAQPPEAHSQICESTCKVFWQPDPSDPSNEESAITVFYQPSLGVSHLVWANSIALYIPHGSSDVNIGDFVTDPANNPFGAKNVTLSVDYGSIVGRLDFKDIPSDINVDFYNYGEIQGSEGSPAVVLSQPVKITNEGWIKGGGGHGGRGGNTTYYAPGYINNFSASDNQVNKVQVWFTPRGGNPAPRYHLYNWGTPIKWDVYSGYVWPSGKGTWNGLHVKAVNTAGTTTGNVDPGTAVGLTPIWSGSTITPYNRCKSGGDTVTWGGGTGISTSGAAYRFQMGGSSGIKYGPWLYATTAGLATGISYPSGSTYGIKSTPTSIQWHYSGYDNSTPIMPFSVTGGFTGSSLDDYELWSNFWIKEGFDSSGGLIRFRAETHGSIYCPSYGAFISLT